MFEVEQLCERVAIMSKGKIIVDSSPSRLREMLRDIRAIEVELKDCINPEEIVQRLAGISIVKRVIETRNDAQSFIIRLQVEDEYEAIPLIAEKLRSLGVKVSSIRQAEPTFEDIFVKLTKEGKS